MISRHHTIRILAFTLIAIGVGCSSTAPRHDAGEQPDWVSQSDRYFDGFVHARAQYQPNIGSHNGMREFDAQADWVVDDIETRDLKLAAEWREKALAGLRDAKEPELKVDLKLFL